MSEATRTILDVMSDLFAAFFADASWDAWRAFLAAVFGLAMSEDQAAIVRAATGRQALPTTQAREVWAVVGRRGGKSRIASLLGVFLACFRPYTLAAGERGVVMVIASDRRQARVVMRYVAALLDAVPMLRALVTRRTSEAIDLANGITIEIHSASFRAVRGYTIVAAICDELAFWPTEDAAEPDVEIINAVRPAMATVPGALLVAISSPYARRGELWRAYKDHHGKDGDPVLVWQADTRTMNPRVPEDVVSQAYAEDEAVASAEWGALFRRDLEPYISREAIEAVTMPGRLELPPMSNTVYSAFVDPSGGSADSMVLAVGHRDSTGRAVLDVLRERRPPSSPEAVVHEFCEVLRTYGVSSVVGDRYGGEFCREPFTRHGITYRLAEKNKSEYYQEALGLLNSGTCELLDVPRLRAQLVGLERRTARSGKDSIDHAPGGHDDVCNAVAGVLVGTRVRPAQEVELLLG